jgi:hypothetical protein
MSSTANLRLQEELTALTSKEKKMAERPEIPRETVRPVPNTHKERGPSDVTDRIRKRAYSIWQSEGGPTDRHEEHWLQAEHEVLHEADELEGDDIPNLAAIRELAREHTDAFIVKTDLEDADQREATPGVREQP